MRAMRDSGVEWIGEIPEGWSVSRIKRLFSEINERCEDSLQYTLLSVSEYYGVAPRESKISENEMVTHAESLDGYKICKKNDIVMNIMLAWKRALGASAYTGIVSPAYCVYRPKVSMDIRYYHYLFRTDQFASVFKQYSTGIIDSRLRLYPEKFLALRCQVPPTTEQCRITNYLDAKCAQVDAIIAKQQKVIEKLKDYKLSVITEAVTKGLNPDAPTKDSGIEWIGEINDSYKVLRIGRFCFVTKLAGFEYTNKMVDAIKEQGPIPIVRAQNVRMFHFSKNTINEYIDIITSNELKRCCLNKKALLITFIGAGIGDTCIFNEPYQYHLAPNVAKIEIRAEYSNQLMEEFLMYYLGSNAGKGEILQISKASAQPSLSMETIRGIKITLPSLEEQQLLVAYLEKKCLQIDLSIEKKQTLIEKLTAYKKSLIYEVVTGKKEV